MAIYNYKMEPLMDISNTIHQEQFIQGMKTVETYLNKTYPIVIGGEQRFTNHTYVSKNPANHNEIIGTISQASIQDAEDAVQSAMDTFASWKKTKASMRADILFKTAAILRRRKFEFSALLVKEAGKPWLEADGDTCEAIDFLEYYGRQMLELETIDSKVLSRRNIEKNEYRYIPLGVGAIIAPWNFPLAILVGMSSAAIVAGNTVVVKPAMTTQVIAYKFYEALKEAGLPDGVFHFIPGKGSEVGEYIVNHPKIRFISFTGSKEVGIKIYENAAKVGPNQIWLKRVIAEMGGKDAILVDKDVDVEQAATIIVESAFGFSGQKCSACSRAIIHEAVYEKVTKWIAEKAKKIIVGDPADITTEMGPVNDKGAYRSILEYIAIAKEEGTIIAGGNAEDKIGWFIEPTVVKDVLPSARIMKEEIFGPVLALCKVSTFEEGLLVANDTEFGLTGAVLSNNRDNIEKAKEVFHVGNLYINRKCTGAIVGYQPFGGFNMSGTDSKAGGPDYLLLHMQGQTITEQF